MFVVTRLCCRVAKGVMWSQWTNGVTSRQNLILTKNMNTHFMKCAACVFHTSRPRYIHPLILLVIRPASKILSIVVGRYIRKWWQSLPKKKQAYFLKRMLARRTEIMAYSGTITALWIIFLISHIEETPVTKRRRFMLFHPDQFEAISQEMFKIHLNMHKRRILPTHHPAYSQVKRVTDRLIQGNTDYPHMNKKWSITIVNDPAFNAFVLPSGQIFVYTGMLRICANEDQLGAVLGHEMSHAVLAHTAELVSYHHILDMIMMVIATAIWALLPSDLTSIIVHFLTSRLKKVFTELPYSRKLEIEADRVGLFMAAKACFDVRECSAFWTKMEVIRQMRLEMSVEWLSTHPSHEKRAQKLNVLIPKALKMRADSKCPVLFGEDPRKDAKTYRQWLEAEQKKQLMQLSRTRRN